jgi:hypothetical protein
MQIKPHFTPTGVDIIKKVEKTSLRGDMEKWGPLYSSGYIKWNSYFGK